MSSEIEQSSLCLSVGQRSVFVPEHVLCAAASALQLATGGYVALEDYADSVASVLTALERRGLVAFHEAVPLQSRDA